MDRDFTRLRQVDGGAALTGAAQTVAARLAAKAATKGWFRASLWAASRTLACMGRLIFAQETALAFSRNAAVQTQSQSWNALGLTLRLGTADDREALSHLYAGRMLHTKLQSFEERCRSGHACVVALVDEQLVGIAWVATTTFFDRLTGLSFKISPGTWLGFDLYVHPAHRHRRVGLALLQYLLGLAHERGLKSHVMFVIESNLPMLATAYRLQYDRIGFYRCTRYLCWRFYRWQIQALHGRGPGIVV